MSVRQAIQSALNLLTLRDRRLLGLAVLIQMSTSALDLVGVLLIGLVGALSVTTIQSQPPPAQVTDVADWIGLQDLTDQQLVLALAAVAAAVLLMKSLISSVLTRRVFVFLANRQALVSARLTKALLARPLTFIQQRASQETAFALIYGAASATMAILGQMVVAATELALLVVLGIALLFVSPWVALASIAFFSLVAFGLQRIMGGWANRVGSTAARADIASMNAVQEAIGAYREISVSDRRSLYVERIQQLRWQAARVAADAQFIGMIPKYIFEVALVFGGLVLAAVLFSTQDSAEAVGTLALFMAAGTRVMPSLLRLQSAALGLRGAAGGAQPTFELAEDLGNPKETLEKSPLSSLIRDRVRLGFPDFVPSLEVQEVSVTYPGATHEALSHISLSVAPGESVALVGRSGAGKSTLADLILGVLTPDRGTVSLGGVSPASATATWPGGISYIPQDVVLANDTVRGNVALGLPMDAIDDELVWEALERAQLADYLRKDRQGIDTHIGESGVRLSGGQRQRLGIARALYTRPKLLVMDEATSALDAETEEEIAATVRGLEGQVTTVIIAHRLSTVRHVDKMVYLKAGRLVMVGSFEQVRAAVPDLQRQADLMGLK